MKTSLLSSAVAGIIPATIGSVLASNLVGPNITLSSGPIIGNARDALGILSFKGIPYAQPPIGNLRWTSPTSPTPWTAPVNATQFGSSCWSSFANGPPHTPYNEDCLTVNVWTGAQQVTEQRPVMVWIYGGGFQFGSSSDPLYDGTAFAEQGVILVSFNYRLGVFGFLGLSELDKDGPHNSGNFGLQDQLFALHWVQQNIAAFGGDPHKVTIFGQSAGAHSVGLLMASPLSPGLFNNAIMESGAWWDRNHGSLTTFAEARQYGSNFEAKLGVTSVAGQRGLSAQTINNADPYNLNQDPGITGFAPSIDGYVVPIAPGTAFHNGQQLRIPLLAGFVADEQALFEGLALPHANANQFEAAATILFGSQVKTFVELYPDNTPGNLNASSSIFVGDLVIREQTWEAADTQHKTAGTPVWFYYYNYTSAYSPDPAHTAEEPFVFGNLIPDPVIGDIQPPGGQDKAFSKQVMSYWTNFAKSSNPNAAGLPTWPAYGNGGVDILELTDTTAPINYNFTRLEFIGSFRQNGVLPASWRNVPQTPT